VTARAAGVLAHFGCGEHRHVRMAAATLDGLRWLELVRAMAPDAFPMPLWKQRSRCNFRFGLLVTFCACGHRVGRGRMLVLVTSRTSCRRSLALRRVGSRNFGVALLTRGWLRRCMLMNLMAGDAIAGSMHLDRRSCTLFLRMTARTSARRRLLRRSRNARVRSCTETEGVTRRAV
jgi:hypothetical protein